MTPPPALPPPPAPALSLVPATAVIRDLAGLRIGEATFTDSYAGVIVTGTVSGLGLGLHAVHIHALGRCESPFTTAGPHFSPDRRKHGFKNREGPHLGDMPNLDLPPAGTSKFEFVLRGVSLTGANALIGGDGTAIVFHSMRDDYATDPSGESGGRLACGVIRKP